MTDIDPSAHPPAATRRTTSGRWATPARAARAPRSTSTARPTRPAASWSTRATPEVIEIWNLVFIQFNRNADKNADAAAGQARRYRHGLRARHGGAAGQGRATTTPTCSRRSSTAIQQGDRAPTYTGKLDDLKDTAYRVIADHIRTLTFALTDGATLGNEGRDYVLRAHPAPGGALRLAVPRHERSRSCTSSCRRSSSTMGGAFPELKRDPQQGRRRDPRRGGELPPHARPRHQAVSRRRPTSAADAAATSSAARTRSTCTTPTASSSTSPSRWRRRRA